MKVISQGKCIKKLIPQNLMELRHGYKRLIANNVACAESTVTEVLKGNRSQKTTLGKAIVRMAKECKKSESNLINRLVSIRQEIINQN